LVTTYELFFIASVIFFAGCVQGIIGFGFGMIAIALVSTILPIQDTVPFLAVFSALLNMSLAIQHRKNIRRIHVLPLIVGGLLGAPVGIFLFASIQPEVLLIGLGALLLFYAFNELFGLLQLRADVHRLWGYIAGFFGGILGAAYNTGGPPVVLYTSVKNWPKDIVVATLQIFFSSVSIIQIAGFASQGYFRTELLLLNAKTGVALALGILVAGRLYPHVNQAIFRRLTLFGIAALGFSLILRNAL
tara:strand:+ start:1045 stop:1782 length:738 start_codon:yes stop_codon:yes gene_type:complete